MKIKLTVLIVLFLSTVLGTGCSGTFDGKTTGFKYILSQAEPKKPPVRNHDYKEEESLSPLEPREESTSSVMPPDVRPPEERPPEKSPSKTPAVDKTVYLTFDDGPNNTETPLILDILDSYGVKGTFFVIGTNIKQHPAVLKDIINRGHAIGNHTYDHKYTEVYASNEAFLVSVKQNEELIFQLGGIRPKVVRDPGGEVRNNKAMKDLLAQNGYNLVDWNIDSYDSRKPAPDGAQIVESVRHQATNSRIWPDMIVLMHDSKGHMNTVRALPTVIEVLKREGFKFATLK